MKRRPTTQDISWFLDLNDNDQVNLSPPYQRRSVWTRKDRIYFLDTIFNGYPCPAVFLHKTVDELGRATYHVVDGKQRIETIFIYANNKMSMPKDYHDSGLAGKKFKDLCQEYKQKFWDYVLAVDMLDIVEQAVVDEVFDRLNRNSRKLERQELRHAKFDGWFITFAESQSELDVWRELGISTSSRSKRMKDVQFISELMMAAIDKKNLGFSQDAIDEFYAEYDSPSEDMPDFNIEEFEFNFSSARDFIKGMNEHNSCVTEYARNFMHFYTLWALVYFGGVNLGVKDFADKYKEFMSSYISVEKDEIKESEKDSVSVYALNSVGANTEQPQREKRYSALKRYMSNEDS